MKLNGTFHCYPPRSRNSTAKRMQMEYNLMPAAFQTFQSGNGLLGFFSSQDAQAEMWHRQLVWPHLSFYKLQHLN
jgi:hypothetical protein